MKLKMTETQRGVGFTLEIRGYKFSEVIGNDEAREMGLTTRRKLRNYALTNFRETIISQIESQSGRGHAIFARIGFNFEMLRSFFWPALAVIVCGAFGLGLISSPKESQKTAIAPVPITDWSSERIAQWCSSAQVETSERMAQIYDRVREERSKIGIVKAIIQARIGSRNNNLAQRVHVVAARRYLLSWTLDEIRAAASEQAETHDPQRLNRRRFRAA